MVSVLLTIFAYQMSTEHIRSVEQTLAKAAFLDKVHALFLTVVDAETGQRGYLLTGDQAYLAPFLAAREQLPQRFAEINNLAVANGIATSQLDQLKVVLQEKMSELEYTVNLQDHGQHQAAIAHVETGRGHILMENIRASVRAMEQTQQQAFHQRLQRLGQRQALLNQVLVSSIAITLLFLYLAYRLSNRFANERALVEEEFRRLNAALEGRVRARTAELEASTKELERRSKDLERSNGDLTQFAYVASHDLQEPLRMVRSYMTLLDKRYADALEENARTYIKFAAEGAARMQTLISDLLQYSRTGTEPYTKRPVAVEELVNAAIQNLAVAIAESSASVSCASLPVLMADATRMIQVFQNLISNAIKFRQPEACPRIKISAELTGEDWLISVNDNGIGFNMADGERIFEIFQRLHRGDAFAGNGIGLSVCRRIIEQHGGRLWAQSTPGEGTTFYFTLPVLETQVKL